jgi:hypothetical protein
VDEGDAHQRVDVVADAVLRSESKLKYCTINMLHYFLRTSRSDGRAHVDRASGSGSVRSSALTGIGNYIAELGRPLRRWVTLELMCA